MGIDQNWKSGRRERSLARNWLICLLSFFALSVPSLLMNISGLFSCSYYQSLIPFTGWECRKGKKELIMMIPSTKIRCFHSGQKSHYRGPMWTISFFFPPSVLLPDTQQLLSCLVTMHGKEGELNISIEPFSNCLLVDYWQPVSPGICILAVNDIFSSSFLLSSPSCTNTSGTESSSSPHISSFFTLGFPVASI